MMSFYIVYFLWRTFFAFGIMMYRGKPLVVLQLLLGCWVPFLLWMVYLFLLLLGFAGIILDQVDDEELPGEVQWVVPVVVVATVVLHWIPNTNLTRHFDRYNLIYFAQVRTIFSSRDDLVLRTRNQLNEIITRIQNMAGDNEVRIHVVGYSMGTIFALQTLSSNAYTRPDNHRLVQNLITFGCPFETVRLYVPKFFQENFATNVPFQWTNIYSKSDILSTCFADLHHPEGTVHEQEYPSPACDFWSFVLFMLAGIRAHGCYWSSVGPTGTDISANIMRIVFPPVEAERDDGN